ncbi:MAG: competence type IV pilus minor pilin ComGF [Breznakia sp.]
MIQRTAKNHKQGFNLIETLLALIIVSFSLSLITPSLRYMTNPKTNIYYRNDQIAIIQLQLLYALSKTITIASPTTLEINYLNRDMQFSLYKNNLLLQEGYQIFLKDVKTIKFYYENNCVKLQYTRNEVHNAILGC